MPSRRRRERQQVLDRFRFLWMLAWRAAYRGSGVVLVALTVGVFFLLAGRWTGLWPSPYRLVVDLAGPPVLLTYAVWIRQRIDRDKWDAQQAGEQPLLTMPLAQLDGLDHEAFEFAVRDLLVRDGFTAERLGGAGDDVCDVRAVDRDGRVWAVQCKHRRDGLRGSAVGVDVLQQLKGTAGPVHQATFALVVTNGRFTKKAVPWGRRHGIHTVDRDLLGTWATGSRPLWDLLHRAPAPLRHPADGRRRIPAS
jgi:restriction system protein